MLKNILMIILVLALALIGVGMYLGHEGIAKLESSYSDSISQEKALANRLKEEVNQKNKEIEALKAELNKYKEDLKTAQAPKEEVIEDKGPSAVELQVKALTDKLQETVDKCTIKPKVVHKPIKKAIIKKEEPKVIIKEVVKPAEPTTIVINKIYVQDRQKGQNKLIKQDKKVIKGTAYPSDLLK